MRFFYLFITPVFFLFAILIFLAYPNILVFAQYPTAVLNCGAGGSQGDECSSTSDCSGACPPTVSYTCQGSVPGQSCGACYCTSATPTGACTGWGACEFDSFSGRWCQTKYCDSGCACNAGNPGCCAYQIMCNCSDPGNGTPGPTGSGATTTPGCSVPGTPGGLYPSGTLACSPNDPQAITFGWGSVAGATSYLLRIDDLANGWVACGTAPSNPGDYCIAIPTGTTYTLNLPVNKNYRWWVSAYNSCGSGILTSPVTLTLPAACPGQCTSPTLSGSGSCSGGVLNLNYSWNAISGASLYRWQVSTNPAFSSFLDNSTTNLTTRSTSEVPGTYYSRVRVETSTGACSVPSNWSNVVTISNTCGPTITPGGPTPTPTVPVGNCSVTGTKSIFSPANICEQANGLCRPATNRLVTLIDSLGNTIASSTTNPYAFNLIPAASYRDIGQTRLGYAPQQYSINSGPWTSGAITPLFACPSATTVDVDWRYTPALGTITTHAKESGTFTCQSFAAMNGLTELSGVQFELERQYFGGSNTGIKSYSFDNSNPSTYLKTTGSASWSEVVIPEFTHTFIDSSVPAGWVKAGTCWYDSGGNLIVNGAGLSDSATGSWPGGTSAVSAFVVYTPPSGWTQSVGGDVYARSTIHSEVPPASTNPFFSLDGFTNGYPGFVNYGGTTLSSFDVYPGLPYGFESSTNTLSSKQWIVNDALGDQNYYSKLTTSIGGVPNTDTPGITPANFTLAQARTCGGICFIGGNVTLTGAWNVLATDKIIVVVHRTNPATPVQFTVPVNVSIANGGFVGFLVDGDITIGTTVGSATYYPAGSPQLSGLYVANGLFSVPSAGVPPADLQLSASGIFVAEDFSLGRDLMLANATDPAQVFSFNSRLLFDMPVTLWQTFVSQQEIAPGWPTPTP